METQKTDPAQTVDLSRIVRELRWSLVHIAAMVIFFAMMIAGGYWMIFKGRDDVMNAFRGAYIMYASVKIDEWLRRKSGLPNAKDQIREE